MYLFLISTSLIFLSHTLYNFLNTNINIFEFDTAYFINIVIGAIKDYIPNINTLNGNSVWTCADNLLDQCLGEKIPTIVQNDLLPIEYTSGYLMVFITAFLSKLSLSFQNLDQFNSAKIVLSTIIKSYSFYCVIIYLLCSSFLIYILNFLINLNLITNNERNIITISFLLVPFFGIPNLTDRIVGEFTSVIYLSAAFLIFCASSLSLLRYKKHNNLILNSKEKLNQSILKSSYFNFALLLLACESKSSVLPTALAIYTSQIILIILSVNKNIKFKNFLQFLRKISFIIFGYFSLFIANKIIPLITYILFKYELAEKFLTKSRLFTSFQASAGRAWGGDEFHSIENTKNLLNNYPFGKNMVFTSFLLIKIMLLIFCINIIFNFIKYKKIKINLFSEKLTLLICNLFILFSAWSFPLIFKFPYPRIIFISISFTLLIPISIGLLLYSRQFKGNN